MKQEMAKFATGKLHSGSKKGPKVTSRKQAVAIAMKESGLSRGTRSRDKTRYRRA